ncbi:MAG: hypothetical protein LKE29_04645 [Acidaminococcaceae bacterium]|jgi:hypothetical protein|nr:hypothetical protein [Acidaminococcaceae bacterium]
MKNKILLKIFLLALFAFGGMGCATSSHQIPPGQLKSFSFATGGSSRYEIRALSARQEGQEVRLQVDTWVEVNGEDQQVQINKAVNEPDLLPRLGELIREQQLSEWNGFDGKNANALDGNSFSFLAVYDQGGKIQAKGYIKMPKNYQKGRTAILNIFEPYVKKYQGK